MNTRVARVAFQTLGCKVNRVESDTVAADLLGRGAELADISDANVVVINTCTVTGEADAKARKAIRQALKAPCAPIVVVTGCLAVLDADALQSLGDRVVVEADKARLSARVADLLGLDEGPHSHVHHATRTGEHFRTRAMLKVEDGCDNFCTYCIVPYARGVPRGVPLDVAVEEAASLVGAGAREIVLTGINIGRYRDPQTSADLATLVEAVAATGIERLRLSSIEPPDLTARLLGVMASTSAACEHLHVPLQSGSDSVLARMGRTYTVSDYAGWIEEARSAIPGLAVTTDVIAGFPEETADEHADTLAFIERSGFSKLHVFRYSARPGTPAAAMGQVAPEERARRARELRDLGEKLRERFVAQRLGRDVEVLVESTDAAGCVGTTRDYLRVRVDAPGATPGETATQVLSRGNVLLG